MAHRLAVALAALPAIVFACRAFLGPLPGLLPSTLAASLPGQTLSAGAAQTIDGKSYVGAVRLDPSGGGIAVTPALGSHMPVRIAPDNLLSASFSAAPSAASGGHGKPAGNSSQSNTPLSLVNVDIGPVGLGGSTTFDDGVYRVRGAGFSGQGATDAVHFLYRAMGGQQQLVAHLTCVVGPNRARVGLMIRESTQPDSPYVAVFLINRGQPVISVERRGAGRRFWGMEQETPLKKPLRDGGLWLRIVRANPQIIVRYSEDGVEWQDVPSRVLPKIDFTDNCLAGIFIISENPTELCTALFDHVSIGPISEHPLEQPRDPGTANKTANIAMPRGVLLRSGTLLACDAINSLDQDQLTVRSADQSARVLAANQVARVVLGPLTRQLADKLPLTGTGLLLRRGDFIEGDISDIKAGSVHVSSVLFGLQEFPIGDAAVAVLHDVDPSMASFIVTTTGGSRYAASSLEFAATELVVHEPVLGEIHIPAAELLEIRSGAGRFGSLTEIAPTKTTAPPDASAVQAAAFTLDAKPNGQPLRLGLSVCRHSISLAAGASADFQVSGQYKYFLARIGLAEGSMPVAPLKFIVLVDGKEVYRSPSRQALDAPLDISVNIAACKILTLRVESTANPLLPATGVWGDPSLVK